MCVALAGGVGPVWRLTGGKSLVVGALVGLGVCLPPWRVIRAVTEVTRPKRTCRWMNSSSVIGGASLVYDLGVCETRRLRR